MTSLPYISDHYAPVAEERTAEDLVVRGTLPPELDGRYLRNGHNPKPGVTPTHWFKGSGMIHGLRLRDGRAQWYRNRWVRTPLFEGTADGDDLTASVAGTHVIEHAGRLLALQEANLPFEIDASPGSSAWLPRAEAHSGSCRPTVTPAASTPALGSNKVPFSAARVT
ncbi:MAG TPA: carotenoid oxygenase family protein [Kutzneria sp.]|jgi:carotenoid cleavage dioxygenase